MLLKKYMAYNKPSKVLTIATNSCLRAALSYIIKDIYIKDLHLSLGFTVYLVSNY